jgi:hypothetical protein
MNRASRTAIAVFSVCLFAATARGQDAAFAASNLRGSIVLNGNQWQSVTTNPVQSSFGFSNWTQMITHPLIPTTGWVSGRVPTLPMADGVTTSGWFQTPFYLPASANGSGRRFFIDVGQIGHYGAIYINGVYAGQNYGQYAPVEAEVTGLLSFNAQNTLQIYVHNADVNYARPGGIVEPSCTPPYLANCGGASYRPYAHTPAFRNWIAITGDVKLVWRPATYATVYTIPSWRNQTISALVSANGTGAAGASATVVDSSGNLVASLPFQQLSTGSATLTAQWPSTSPWWNIGSPHLYWMNVRLLDGSGAMIDLARIRFGPREAYVAGGTYFINGQKPVLIGDYWLPVDTNQIDVTNRPDELAFYFGQVLESSGANTIVEHWNPLSETERNLADELGFAVVDEMYCQGATAFEDEIDSATGWETWMEGQAQSWIVAQQNHPSVVMMRPIDVVPAGISQKSFFGLVKSAAKPLDPQNLPWGDGSDIAYFSSSFAASTSAYNPTWISEPPQNSMPQFIKELYGAVNGSGALAQWTNWWNATLTSGGNGMMAQSLYMWSGTPWTPSWNNGGSGLGVQPAKAGGVPDFQSGKWTPSPESTAWAAFGFGFNGATTPVQGSYVATGMTQVANSAAFLISSGRDPVGVLADSVGAQFNPLFTGAATLDWTDGTADHESPATVSALP